MDSTGDSSETHETTAVDIIQEQAETSIRREWHDGRWFFSVIDVIGILTDSRNPRNYWNMLKSRMRDERWLIKYRHGLCGTWLVEGVDPRIRPPG